MPGSPISKTSQDRGSTRTQPSGSGRGPWSPFDVQAYRRRTHSRRSTAYVTLCTSATNIDHQPVPPSYTELRHTYLLGRVHLVSLVPLLSLFFVFHLLPSLLFFYFFFF